MCLFETVSHVRVIMMLAAGHGDGSVSFSFSSLCVRCVTRMGLVASLTDTLAEEDGHISVNETQKRTWPCYFFFFFGAWCTMLSV